MKIVIKKPVEFEIKVGTKLLAFDYEEMEWIKTEVVSVNNDLQTVDFRSNDGLEWTEQSLVDLCDSSTYNWMP